MRFLLLGLSSAGKAVHALWTGPSLLAAAFIVAWGAETAQYLVSQGLALALLAWLQTLPEFAVEANISWHAARGTQDYSIHDVTANFTGSIRLIMGFGMPVVYFIYGLTRDRNGGRRWGRPIRLDPFHSIEVVNLFPPVIYLTYIVIKGSLDVVDSVVLLAQYAIYLALLLKMPPEKLESFEELPAVSRMILRRGRRGRVIGVTGLFVLGGIILYLTVHPFVESLKGLAIWIGIPGYFMIQWVAPFLSEMPEKVSAFNWARQEEKAKLGLMNFLSSNLNQLTCLIGMIPLVFVVSQWTAGLQIRPFDTIVFDLHQRKEVMLTAAQALLCLVLLLNMKFEWWNAAGLFLLWFIQFIMPNTHHIIVFVYLGWVALEVVLEVAGVRHWRFPMRARRKPA